MPASLCVFYQYDNEYDELVARHAFGASIEKALGQRIPLGHNLTGWVGSNRRTIRNSDPTLDFGEEIREFEPSLLSCLSSPVVDDDTLVGVLSLYVGLPRFRGRVRTWVSSALLQLSPLVVDG